MIESVLKNETDLILEFEVSRVLLILSHKQIQLCVNIFFQKRIGRL